MKIFKEKFCSFLNTFRAIPNKKKYDIIVNYFQNNKKAALGTIIFLLFGTVIIFNFIKMALISYFISHRPPNIESVAIYEIKPTVWHSSISSFGIIEPVKGVTISTEEEGKVDAINFFAGDSVKKGDIIVALNTDLEKANLNKAKSQLPFVEKDFIRMKQLLKTAAASQKQFDDTALKLSSVEAEIAAYNALINKKTITAPFDGKLGIINVYLGEYLTKGKEVVRLEDNTLMLVRFSVPQKKLSSLHLQQVVHIASDAYSNKIFEGQISAIDNFVKIGSGVLEIQAIIQNNTELLRSGMFANVDVILPDLDNQIVIPQAAIEPSLYGEIVYVVVPAKESNKYYQWQVEQRLVTTTEQKHDLALITSGLNIGDKVVTFGQFKLSNGMPVKVIENGGLQTPNSLPRL